MTRAIYYLAALALFAFALVVATQTVSGVTWPCEIDFYRDMGAAQGLLDGRLFEDSAYLGEIRWYNPLLPAVYATITAALDLPLNEVVARSGPVLNLLGPVFFYLLALSLMGPLAALAALVAYLFLGNHSEPSWFHATYSPWAWPMNFTQGIAFAAFLAYLRARRRPGIVREALAGAILGVTALSHTAPALIIAATVSSDCLLDVLSRDSRNVAIRRFFAVGLVSLLFSLPFLAPIFSAYRFHIVNLAPSGLSVFWGSSFLRNLVSPVTAGAALGAIVLVAELYRVRGRDDRRLIILFALVSLALLCYGIAAQILVNRFGIGAVQIVPAFHFHLYLKAAECLLFGAAVAAFASRAAKRIGPVAGEAVALGVVVALVAVYLPRYFRNVDLDFYRREAIAYSADSDRIAVYEWIMSRAAPSSVFLAERDLAMYIVAAAGRKTVALDAQYSNPYVDYDARVAARQAMFDAIRAGDRERFLRSATEYDVDYVLTRTDRPEECCVVAEPPGWLKLQLSVGPFRIFRPE